MSKKYIKQLVVLFIGIFILNTGYTSAAIKHKLHTFRSDNDYFISLIIIKDNNKSNNVCIRNYPPEQCDNKKVGKGLIN